MLTRWSENCWLENDCPFIDVSRSFRTWQCGFNQSSGSRTEKQIPRKRLSLLLKQVPHSRLPWTHGRLPESVRPIPIHVNRDHWRKSISSDDFCKTSCRCRSDSREKTPSVLRVEESTSEAGNDWRRQGKTKTESRESAARYGWHFWWTASISVRQDLNMKRVRTSLHPGFR